MEKLDLVKTYKTYYHAATTPQLVDIPAAPYLAISGKGEPEGAEFAKRLEALYTAAYTLKFNAKSAGKDFAVPKLEGLWSYDKQKYQGLSMSESPVKIPRSEWYYRLLLRIPDYISEASVEQAVQQAMRRKDNPFLPEVTWFWMHEGRSVQMLHKGPFEKEPESLEIMRRFMEENSLEMNGMHHEIYLSDFRRTAPERLRTILREPVKR